MLQSSDSLRIAWYLNADRRPLIHFPPALWQLVCEVVGSQGNVSPRAVIVKYIDHLIQMNTAQPLAATKDVAHSRPSSCLRSWRVVPRSAAIVLRALKQASKTQRRSAADGADARGWILGAAAAQSNSAFGSTRGLHGGLRPICVYQRHPLLICVESCLLGAGCSGAPREFRKSPQYARICQVSSTKTDPTDREPFALEWHNDGQSDGKVSQTDLRAEGRGLRQWYRVHQIPPGGAARAGLVPAETICAY